MAAFTTGYKHHSVGCLGLTHQKQWYGGYPSRFLPAHCTGHSFKGTEERLARPGNSQPELFFPVEVKVPRTQWPSCFHNHSCCYNWALLSGKLCPCCFCKISLNCRSRSGSAAAAVPAATTAQLSAATPSSADISLPPSFLITQTGWSMNQYSQAFVSPHL